MSESTVHPRDFSAGGLFAVTGLMTSIVASQYPTGTAMRMGAGYFPQLLGLLLLVLGGFVLLRGAVRHFRQRARVRQSPNTATTWWSKCRGARPLFLIGTGVMAFAGLLGNIGLAAATLLLVVVSGSAHHESRFPELLMLGVGLAIFGASVFIWGLGLPLPLLPG